MNISLAALKEAVEIKEQIAAHEARLKKIFGGGGGAIPDPFLKAASTSPIMKKGRKKMSAAARARIGEAKRSWWAKQKGSASVAKPAKKKRHLSAEGRAAIVAALKKRWAAKRK